MTDKRIVCVDISNSNDFSVICQRCSNCNTVFKIKAYDPYIEEFSMEVLDRCPSCGVKFSGNIIMKTI